MRYYARELWGDRHETNNYYHVFRLSDSVMEGPILKRRKSLRISEDMRIGYKHGHQEMLGTQLGSVFEVQGGRSEHPGRRL